MPYWANISRISRLLRKRLVYVAIFVILVLFWILTPKRKELTDTMVDNDFEDFYYIQEPNGTLNDGRNLDIPLLWHLQVINDIKKQDYSTVNSLNLSTSDTLVLKHCRNSKQGKILLTDERGFVCYRDEILDNGCCNVQLIEKKQKSQSILRKFVPSLDRKRYSCRTCNVKGCCGDYEYCVSCCLNPAKHRKQRHMNKKVKDGKIDYLKLRLQNLDPFELCLAACRTSSASVVHESTYKNSNAKHCYTLQLPTRFQDSTYSKSLMSIT